MAVNADKVHRWKEDIARSIDMYNEWFLQFAPAAYREQRTITTQLVKDALEQTANLTNVTPTLLRQYPDVVRMLRMVTAPPIARDRLIGLAGVSKTLVETMEKDHRMPPQMSAESAESALLKIGQIIMRLADRDLFPWLATGHAPTDAEVTRAATVVADRLCGAATDPIVRNAQERRQLAVIDDFLRARGYSALAPGNTYETMPPGTYAHRLNVPGMLDDGSQVNIPVDAVIFPQSAAPGVLPLLVEAKSAGDFTNVNKRRKEEGIKVAQLRRLHGPNVRFVLFLCGYFDSSYLGYEAAEGIDWVWEHRVEDLAQFGV